MALSVDSKIKEILRDPKGKEVIEKWYPGFSQIPALKLIQMLTFRKLLSYPESAELAEHVDEIDADLRAI